MLNNVHIPFIASEVTGLNVADGHITLTLNAGGVSRVMKALFPPEEAIKHLEAMGFQLTECEKDLICDV